VLSAKGSPAEILRASRHGQFELVVSELLLAELKRTLANPKLRKRIAPEKAQPSLTTGSATTEPSLEIQQATASRLPTP
jgi:predicted nucleic acid-binding protein